MMMIPAGLLLEQNDGYLKCSSGETQGGSGVRGVGRGGRAAEGTVKPKPRKPKDHFRATELCTFFAAGACSRGTSCNFAHDVADLKQKPNFKKTRLCEKFTRTGWCPSGANCSFAHSKAEMQAATSLSRKAKRGLLSKVSSTPQIAASSPGQQVAEKPGCQGKSERATARHGGISTTFKEPPVMPDADRGEDLGMDPFSAHNEPTYASQNFDGYFPQHLQESILAVLRENNSHACREVVTPELANGVVLSL